VNRTPMNCLATRLAIWLLSLALFSLSPTLWKASFLVEVLERVQCTASPLEHGLDLIARAAKRILEAEIREPDAWLQDDYRIARTTLGFARAGSPAPHVEATYAVVGCHPDQVWSRMMARREAMVGAASRQLFSEEFFGGISSPRKPVRSVTVAEAKAVRRKAA